MGSNFSSIGFRHLNPFAFTVLANNVKERAGGVKFGDGFLSHNLKINDGIECIAVSKNDKIFCFKAFFRGSSFITLKLFGIVENKNCPFDNMLLGHVDDEKLIPPNTKTWQVHFMFPQEHLRPIQENL
ncbi:MAG: hypothetical protein HZB68_01870 [Candidatus Aenigmarchaeota archaeon]|nr:hypothetical protein [Candidatus Aenigmarchaeota archaeon]